MAILSLCLILPSPFLIIHHNTAPRPLLITAIEFHLTVRSAAAQHPSLSKNRAHLVDGHPVLGSAPCPVPSAWQLITAL